MFSHSDAFPGQFCTAVLHNNALHKTQLCQNQQIQPNLIERTILRPPMQHQAHKPGQLVQAPIVNISPLGVMFKVTTLLQRNMIDHSEVLFEEDEAVLVFIPFSKIVRTESHEPQRGLYTKADSLPLIRKATCTCRLRSHKERI
jgi:hypothetical protein